jgi:DivIVA domain-containing protein
VASQGQRFRRKALRRGYKVDEVDAFLDRVEATLAGTPMGPPVSSQDVHDVVFRVRFGGYDEWQVDLHLDRVERQVAELEERGAGGRGPGSRPGVAGRVTGPDRMGPPVPMGQGPMGPPDRMGPPMGQGPMGPPDRMGPTMGQGPMGPPDRMGPPLRDDRGAPGMPPPLPPRPLPAQSGPPRDPYGRYDEPSGSFSGFEAGRGGYEPNPPGRQPTGPGPGRPPGYGPDDRFGPGRHGKVDMTTEIQMPDHESRPAGRGPGMAAPPASGPGLGGPPMGPGMGGGAPGGGALQHVDQIRRSLQVRRFGSGYDPNQVNRFFDEILNAMSGRGPMPVAVADLDSTRFGLVPGGYFEAEVETALRQVKDILRRR